MVRVLVTGGAGYIGAHVVRELGSRGHDVRVVDDLSTSNAARVAGVPLHTLDLVAPDAPMKLADIMRGDGVDAVVHLAAKKKVDESVARPLYYVSQNVGGLSTVLEASASAGVDRLVFSSTAAVYGPSAVPVDESAPTAPVNMYGESKLFGERMITAQSRAHGLDAISLRYFNVLGASDPELDDTDGTNVVPIVFGRLERGEPAVIYGDDYDTRDGTCLRDYVHVADVATAHADALDALAVTSDPSHRVYNVGTGVGTTVRELVDEMMRLVGSHLEPLIAPRRPGDAAVVIADARRLEAELGWRARFGAREALASAWAARHR